MHLNWRVGYLFQNPDHQISPPHGAGRAFPLACACGDSPERRSTSGVEEAVELFSLPDLVGAAGLMSYGGTEETPGRHLLPPLP